LKGGENVKKNLKLCFAGVGTVFLVVCLIVPEAFAVAVPGAGSFAYDIYDIAVVKILGGPIGFVAGVGAVAYGGVQAWTGNMWTAIPAVLGGAVVLKAEAITTTLGAMI